MGARRYRALHFGDMDGKNVPFHREHRSKRGRAIKRVYGMTPYEGNRNGWKPKSAHLLGKSYRLKDKYQT